MILIGHKGVKEKSIPLSQVDQKQERVFRFATDNFKDACENNNIYRICKEPATSEGDVKVFNISTGEVLKRNGTHQVILHDFELTVVPNVSEPNQ